MLRRALVLLALAASGCPSLEIQRSGTVPHFAPPMRSGRPLAKEVEGTVGGLLSFGAPTPGPNDNTSIRVPRRQFDLAVRSSPFETFDAGFIWVHGIGNGSEPIRVTNPDTRDRDPTGPGITVGSTTASKNGFGLAVEGQLILFFIPYDVIKECTADCRPSDPTSPTKYSGRAAVPVGVVALIPNYTVGPLTLFANVTMRNHVNVREASSDAGIDTGVDLGPVMFSLGAGAEISIPPGINLALMAYNVYSGEPLFGSAHVEYQPTMAVWISFPMSDRPPKPRPRKKSPDGFEEAPPPIERPYRPGPDDASPDPRPARPPVDDGPIK